MTVTTMLRRLVEILWWPGGWLATSALVALAPKCLLCLAAYAGLGAALGLGGPEICGASSGVAESWIPWLPLSGIVLGASGFLTIRRCRRVATQGHERRHN
jgi:hypothetical protein